jgi:hypothetical protein
MRKKANKRVSMLPKHVREAKNHLEKLDKL